MTFLVNQMNGGEVTYANNKSGRIIKYANIEIFKYILIKVYLQ